MAENKTTVVALSINFITHQTQTQTQPTKCLMLFAKNCIFAYVTLLEIAFF